MKTYTVRVIRIERRAMEMKMSAHSETEAQQLFRLGRYVRKEHPFKRTLVEVVKVKRVA